MKIFVTIIITTLVVSLLWLLFITYYPNYVPVPQFAERYKSEQDEYEQIKKQKEMEMRAEFEIAEDMVLGMFEDQSNAKEEYRLRIEAMNQDLHLANTKGYANDKETANAILDEVEREARDILKTSFFRTEVMALLEKIKETRDTINN